MTSKVSLYTVWHAGEQIGGWFDSLNEATQIAVNHKDGKNNKSCEIQKHRLEHIDYPAIIFRAKADGNLIHWDREEDM